MPWKVKAVAHKSGSHKVFKTVVEVEGDTITEEEIRMIMYWVRNAEPGEKVVISRS